jgi:murein L,D-transpeptidase YcbB/YkuD
MGERIHARETLRRVYPARAYAPLWVTEDGPTLEAERFADWLATEPDRHGLRPADYHLAPINVLEDDERLAALVDLELALSDGLLMVASHLLAGRLDPETLDAEWLATRRHRDLAPVLEQAASSDAPGAAIEALLPADPAYQALIRRLAELRGLRDAGGWPVIEPGPTLRESDTGPRVAALAARLVASGELDMHDGDVFDAPLADAVRRYQTRHGLTADAVVGQATLASLNAPIQARIDRLIVNLERWRWLPETLGERYIIVNIAGFKLDLVEDGEAALSMRVVVGTPFRRTPVFSERISYLVLNPSWHVPHRIAITDKLPLIKANPDYLAQQNYALLQGWGADERVIDPATVDWPAVTRNDFPYRLRQAPGPFNALGRVKFMFPNKFSVYLHDTPARELFGRDARAFSSGCIRLERPLDLAETLLAAEPGWSRTAIDAALATGREQTVRLGRPVPVHLLYWTAWVDPADGTLNFRDDIYGRDTRVLAALREQPPAT